VNDNDPDLDPITIILGSITSPASGGSAIADSTNTGIIYTPGTGFTGSDTFTYQITDGTLQSNLATVTVNVCCIEIMDIRLWPPTNPNYIQVEIKNHCGMPLILANKVQLTWEFTIDPVAPCCGGTAYLKKPGGGPLVYVKNNYLPLYYDGDSNKQKCEVKGNACFTLKLTALVPPTGCSCDTIVKGCVSDLTLCP